MARSTIADFLQNYLFHAEVVDTPIGADVLKGVRGEGHPVEGEAGFQSISGGNVNADVAEYREGIAPRWPRKVIGILNVDDFTFTRGEVPGDTIFFDWLMAYIAGYDARADIHIYHYSKLDVPKGIEELKPEKATHTYKLFNAVPTSVKVVPDFDATSSEVAVSELTVSIERVSVEVRSDIQKIGGVDWATGNFVHSL